jgi:hypothetical protein
VELWTNQITNTAPYRIFFFNAPPDAIADNGIFVLTYADLAKYIGYVDVTNVALEGSTSTAALGLWTGQLAAAAAADDTDLYYVIVTKAVFTPASAQKYTVRVTLDRNG